MTHPRLTLGAAVRLAATLALAGTVACGGGDDDGATTDAATGVDAPDGARTLDTCTTSIASDVPAFYQRYFRCVSITKTATGVAITTQDLPPHLSYYYGTGSPNYVAFDTTRGAEYHANPNTLAAQALTITIPDSPTASGVTIIPDLVDGQAGTNAAEYSGGPIGVAPDSVAPFSGTAAPRHHPAAQRFTLDTPPAPPAQALTIPPPASATASAVPSIPHPGHGQAGTNAAEYRGGPIGVALDSVALFSGTAAPGDDIAAERFTFDNYQAHPEQRGTYHYHAPTPGPLEVLRAAGEISTTTPGAAEVELYGVLCDGTLVLGCTELDGSAPATLDAQGGHVGDVRAADGTSYFAARYHTHVCGTAARGHGYTPEIHYYAACARP